MKTLEDLSADVEAEGTVIASAVILLGGLSAQIADLKNSQTDPETAAKIDALALKVEGQKDALAAAIAANTPAAPVVEQGDAAEVDQAEEGAAASDKPGESS